LSTGPRMLLASLVWCPVLLAPQSAVRAPPTSKIAWSRSSLLMKAAIAPEQSLPVSMEVETPEARTQLGTFLGSGRSILVGMPGAFTPTCTDEHLPGLINSAPAFAENNIENIVVITANDKYVNEAWSKSVAACLDRDPGADMPVTFVADPTGDVLEELGMIAFLGKGLGVRSKRFALIAEDGVALHVVTDKGDIDLEYTSAAALLQAAEAIEKAARATAAETAAAAEIFNMKAADAYAYLQSQQAALLDAGVSPSELDESLEILSEAAGTSGQVSGTAGGEEQQPAAALVGAALAALVAGAGAYLFVQQGGGDLSSLGMNVDVASLPTNVPGVP